MSNIAIHSPEIVSETEVSIQFDIPLSARRYFEDNELKIQYDFPIVDIPESILLIPGLALLCPIAWASGNDVKAKKK